MNTKKLGPSGTGTHHWWLQRITAIALIPLAIYAVYILQQLSEASSTEAVFLLSQPLHGFLCALFFGLASYHARLGLQVVIEDYVHKPVSKWVLLILNQLIYGALAVFFVFAFMYLVFSH